MNKPEYSDLYRFIASLGLILIAFAVGLPWLFMRESFDILVPASEIAELTPTAQTLIATHQANTLWIVQNIRWFSLATGGLGLLLLGGGTFFWAKRQKVVDSTQDLEHTKLEQSMTPEQIAQKVVDEVSLDAESESAIAMSGGMSFEKSAINKYFQTERIVFGKLDKCFGVDNVKTHQRYDGVDTDVVVRGWNVRIVMEIKAVFGLQTSKLTLPTKMERTMASLEKSVDVYDKFGRGRAFGIGLFLFDDELIHMVPEDHLLQVNDDLDVKLMAFTQSQFLGLDCARLRASVLTRPS